VQFMWVDFRLTGVAPDFVTRWNPVRDMPGMIRREGMPFRHSRLVARELADFLHPKTTRRSRSANLRNLRNLW